MLDKTLYSKIIIESLVMRKPLKTDHISIDLIRFAKMNKVLYLLGLYDKRIQRFPEWQELKARREEQKKAMIEVATIAEEHHIDLMVVKTIKPFEYVPDDIDVLVINDDTLDTFTNELLRRGYFLRKKGTPEVTLRKVVGNTFVDLDIHTKLGAGTYEYIDKRYLWKRRTYTLLISDMKVATPNMIDEFLITVAHAIMKELSLTIADILHAISLNKTIREEAIEQARKVGLLKATKFLINVANKTLNVVRRSYDLSNKITNPHRVPVPVIIDAYIENITYRLKTQGLAPLIEIVKIPSSKGIATLLRYIGL